MALSLPVSTTSDDRAEAHADVSAGSTQMIIMLHFDSDPHASRQHSACCFVSSLFCFVRLLSVVYFAACLVIVLA